MFSGSTQLVAGNLSKRLIGPRRAAAAAAVGAEFAAARRKDRPDKDSRRKDGPNEKAGGATMVRTPPALLSADRVVDLSFGRLDHRYYAYLDPAILLLVVTRVIRCDR